MMIFNNAVNFLDPLMHVWQLLMAFHQCVNLSLQKLLFRLQIPDHSFMRLNHFLFLVKFIKNAVNGVGYKDTNLIHFDEFMLLIVHSFYRHVLIQVFLLAVGA